MRPRLIHSAPLAGVLCVLAALRAPAAEPPLRRIDVARALDAGVGSPALPDLVITATPPDPPAMTERAQWVLDLRWDRGDVWLVGVRRLELASGQPTPRVMGRFALELFEGPTLIERVRFDFPLLAAPDRDGAVPLTTKLRTRIGVLFPATRRGTRLELWDRATNRRWSLPWPATATGGAADAAAWEGGGGSAL